MRAIILKTFMATYSNEMISKTNGNTFIYSGDLAILLLLSEEIKLSRFKISNPNEIMENSQVIVAGFPKKPENLLYCCPSLKFLQEEDIKNEIYKAFHNFDKMIYSEGFVINKNENIIEVNCAGTNGMSGDPIFWEKKVVGVYLGGPTLPFQRDLYIVIRLVLDGNLSEAFYRLKELKTQINEFYIETNYLDDFLDLIIKIGALDTFLNGLNEHDYIIMVS